MKITTTKTNTFRRAALTLLALILACAAAWAETVETSYIDENGQEQTVTATVLTGSESNLGTEGQTKWYVVNSNISHNGEIDCDGDVRLILADGNTLTVNSGNDFAVNAFQSLTIYGQTLGTGTLSASCSSHTFSCDAITICGGTVTASNTSDSFCTIAANDIIISGGTVSVSNTSNSSSVYVIETYDITISGGTVNVSGAGTAIKASTLTISGGTVNISNTSSMYAINADNITISGGTVNVSGATIAINASSTLTISDGTVSFTDDQTGIYSPSGTITINGGNISATNSDYGILSPGGTITINGGTVSVTVNETGIFSTTGTITINGGKVTAIATGFGIYSPINTITLGWTNTDDFIKASSYDGTVKVATGFAFLTDDNPPVQVSGTVSDLSLINGKKLTPDLTVIPTFTDNGDDTYTIWNATGWGEFCDALQDATYNHFTGKTVKLGADISITQSAGSDDHRFMGTFDGQEYTLDVDITDTGEQGTAPFRFISNATIRNLHVTGTVTGTTHAAGLVGKAIAGTILIENCLVEANVNSTVGNNRHCGGIVGHGFGGNNPVDLTLRNCVYAGTITCDKNYIGGLQGWSDGNTLTLENCLFAGNYQGTATGTAAFHPIALHNTGSTTSLTATNVFAAVAPTATNANFIAADGTKTTGRTTAPAGLGTQEATYSFMDMTVYENGLYYDGLYYVAPTLSTDNSGAYLINNEDDWTNFCDALYNNGTWNRFSGKTVKLTASIGTAESPVTRMAGSGNHDFCGTFDGQGNTITVSLSSSGENTALFSYISNTKANPSDTEDSPAAILNLKVAGTVTVNENASHKYAGGLVGTCWGVFDIENCHVSTVINSSVVGDGTHGGIVGRSASSTLTITGCVFDGQMLGSTTNACGGIVGFRNGGTVNIYNTLFAPTALTMSETNSATFVRNGDSSTTITDCYYTTALGTAQGTKVYSISKGEYVTTLEINGTATQSYNVSGLSFYSTGIKCGDVLYAVENAQLSLTLANNAIPPLGYQYDYTVTGGATLNGNTLTMAHDDVTVSVDTESGLHSTGQPVSVTYMNADGTTDSHEAIALDETMTNLAVGWYFVGKDIAYTSSIDLYGDITIILADGKTMSVGTSEAPIADTAINGCYFTGYAQLDYAFTVYGQSLAESTAGTLSIHAIDEGICFVKSYTQHSGNVSITSVTRSGIRTLTNSITINGGNLDVNANYVALYTYRDVIINGGTVNATGRDCGIFSQRNVTFGWTNTSDYIYVNKYQVLSGTIAIASGQAFIDDEGNTYNSGTVNASDLNGKTLHPVHGCTQPVQLTATDLTPTSATLNWDGYQDSYNVRYRTDHVVAGTLLNEGFEGYEHNDPDFPEGWTANDRDWIVCEYSQHSGDNSVMPCVPDSYLISPELEISENANVVINFWYSGYGEETLQLEVYYRPAEFSEDWMPLWSSEGSTTYWTEASIPIENGVWGSGSIQLGFKVSGSEYFSVYLDDITVNSYTEYGEWQTINNIAATTTPLTGLTPETPYQWQVQGLDCDGNDGTTEWSVMGTFTTPDPCEAPSGLTVTDITTSTATLNWSGVQDSYVVIYRTADVEADTLLNEDFEGYEFPEFPEGWNNNNSAWYVNSYYHHSGEKSVETDESDSYLITPELEISENANVVINFWYITEQNGEATPQLEVYYRHAEFPDDWMPLWSSEGSHPDWTEASIAVEDWGNIHLGFKVSCSQRFDVYLDDITVTSYTGYGEWQTIDSLAATTTTLTGLTPEMPYQWQVRGISEYCPYSHPEWSERGSFTTQPLLPVSYIDENGEQQLCTDYTVVTSDEATLLEDGWYVVNSDVEFDVKIYATHEIHLILCDGATLTASDGITITTLHIYGQALGTGTINAQCQSSEGKAIYSYGLTINGGIINAQGKKYGLYANNSVTINGGHVTAYGQNKNGIRTAIEGSNITINGGQVTANGGATGISCNMGNITLGWTKPTDFIHANSYIAFGGILSIAEGKAFIDEDGTLHNSGTVNASDINGKWLYPSVVSFFTKTIAGYGTGNNGWYLIASPIGTVAATSVANLANTTNPENFDLYRFNQAAELEWENWKKPNEGELNHYHFDLELGRGYLYANENTVNLVFAGTPYSGSGEVTLTKTEGAEFSGWNLVGNPFSVEAYLDNNRSYYAMNYYGSALVPVEACGPILPMQGVFVIAGEDGETLTFSTQEPAKSQHLTLNVTQGRDLVDRAIVRFSEGGALPKFQFREGSTKVYLPQGGKDYAVVNAETTGEMPVNFKAEHNGTYTLSVNVDNMEMEYLHLIDNLTGADVDLLTQASYTFQAKTTDYTSRFKLVFSANGNADDDDVFAFIDASGNIIVNGEGTLQVFDVLGHQLFTKQLPTLNSQLSTLNYTPGVYVLRLIDGEKVRTQKIVVE